MTVRFPHPPDVKWIPVSYSLLEPMQAKIREKGGNLKSVSFGIGDIITVLEPSMYFPVSTGFVLKEIPLADGSRIVEFSPSNVNTCKVPT